MNVGVEEQLQALTLSEPVRYLRSEAETRTAMSMLQEEVNDGKLSVVGLDIEWPPFEKDAKASTLQLAVADGRVYVIALCELPRMPMSLKVLLADATLAKVGKSIDGDVKRLSADYNLDVQGAIDLAWRAKELNLVKVRNK